MKKIIVFAFVILLSRSAAMAQLTAGAKAGLNLAFISFSDEKYSTSMKTGFHAGGFIRYPLAEKVSLQAELLYSLEGNKWNIKAPPTTGVIKSSQARIPVLIHYKLNKQFALEAGPQFRWLITMKQTAVGATHSIKPLYHTGALGIAAGATWELPGRFPGLSAGLRLNKELSKINKTLVGGGNLRNTVVALSLVYILKK